MSSKIKTPTYSAIWKRVNKLDIKTNPRLGKDIVIAVDSTGVKVANRVRVDEAEMAKEKGILEDSCGSRCKIKADYRLGNHR